VVKRTAMPQSVARARMIAAALNRVAQIAENASGVFGAGRHPSSFTPRMTTEVCTTKLRTKQGPRGTCLDQLIKRIGGAAVLRPLGIVQGSNYCLP
jgi:hypothetical protein